MRSREPVLPAILEAAGIALLCGSAAGLRVPPSFDLLAPPNLSKLNLIFAEFSTNTSFLACSVEDCIVLACGSIACNCQLLDEIAR